jgi:uncharacterized membrane-anchored protein
MKPPGKVSLKNRDEVAVGGIARLDKKTKNLVRRLRPGEVAIIDHEDIDRVSAETLVEKRPLAVINAACSITGRYPNLGPLMIIASGINIVDEVGGQIFELVQEGSLVSVAKGIVYLDGKEVARGVPLSLASVERQIEESKRMLGRHLGDFAANTMELLETEKEILLESIDLPQITTRFAGNHVLIVVRGHDYKRDLNALRPYIREMRPVLVAVDGGADALLEMRYKPQMIVGDMDSITDEALTCGAELVVHGYTDGESPGRLRLNEMGLPSTVFHYPGTSEDIAMMIAYEKGAELIAVVGGHTNLIEFLDKDRKGMASTFLVRLRVGSRLVDAKGIGQIYQTRLKSWQLTLMVLAALLTIVMIVAFSEPVRQLITVLAMRFQVWLMKIQSLI